MLGECKLKEYDFYPILKKLKIKNLWKHLQKKPYPVIYNDLNPLELEILLGNYPIIKNMLISPLLRNGEFMGLIGLCNKESDFDFYDRKTMENISTTIVEALLRKRAEEKLKKSFG